MHFNRLTLVTCLASLFYLTNANAMVGGIVNPTPASFYPATVSIKDVCTAAKVGSRSFLTAAHCVMNMDTDTLDPKFLSGQTIQITNNAQPMFGGGYLPVKVENVFIDPQFVSGCTSLPCNYLSMALKGPDIALIVVTEATPAIPSATVDFSLIPAGTPMIMTGYGCEDFTQPTVPVPSDPVRYPQGRLSFYGTVSFDNLLLMGRGDTPYGTDFFYTPGPSLAPGHAGLCEGDSGGPVYFNDGNRGMKVIGVNSGLSEESAGVAGYFYNVFSRTTNVVSWLPSVLK